MTARPIIVVDDAIAWATDALGPMGELVALPGGSIDRAAVADADALVVRTVTRVDAALVAGSRLGFVGTATAGVDHVDVEALAHAGIRFASAAGCNAHAVVDYVTTALHLLALERDPSLLEGPVAIVGYGHVGRRLAARLRALGATVRVSDPPLARRIAQGVPHPPDASDPWQRLAIDEPLLPLHDAVAGARVLTVHVPLVVGGPDPTSGLIGAAVLARLGPRPVVFNTSRGSIVDERALAALLQDADARAVIDVWTGEPEFDAALALHHRVRIATPHIAGYSLEGKVAATAMVARALADHLGVDDPWRSDSIVGPPIAIEAPTGSSALARATACLRRYNPIERDDAALRALAREPAPRRTAFEALRRDYTWRRALSHHGTDDPSLVAAGFAVRPTEAVVLLAHGSPDPDWRVPLDAIATELQRREPHRRVMLAFLDHLQPPLETAVATLEREGCDAVRVVSVFLSAGGNHIKRDVPALCEQAAAAHPRVRLTLVPGAIGGERDVIEAIAGAVARVTGRGC